MIHIIALLVLSDIIIAVLKTFGLAGPISWITIYWGFISLSLFAVGVEDE